MNRLISIVILFFLISCSTSEQKEIEEKKPAGKASFIPIPPMYKGLWVNEGYLKELSKTRSTKMAQGKEGFYKIYDKNSIMQLDLHEGGAENILVMETDKDGQIYSTDSTQALNKVEFKDGIMVIDNVRCIKAPDGESGLQVLVNKAFFSGKYLLGEKFIEFKDDGSITGLDSINGFNLNLNYVGPGMQFDLINFKLNDKSKDYLYEFKSDTLLISEVDCLVMEEESDFCLEVAKGNEVYRMVKK